MRVIYTRYTNSTGGSSSWFYLGGVIYLFRIFDWFWFALLFVVVLFCCCFYLQGVVVFICRVYTQFASLNPTAVLHDKHAKLPFSKTMELPELRVFINSLQLRHCCLSLLVTAVFLSPHFCSKENGRFTHIINGITHRERKVYCVFLPVFPLYIYDVFQRGDLIFISF